MAKLAVGEIVRMVGGQNPERREGFIEHITCKAATKSGGSTCKRSNCTHNPKDRVWVRWPNDKIFSYTLEELENDPQGEINVLSELDNLVADGEVEDASKILKDLINVHRNRVTHTHKASPQPAVAETPKQQPGSNMTTKPSLMDMFKADGVDAAYRVASTQITTGVQSAILEVMKKKGADNAQLETLAMFLGSELGAGMLSIVSGYGLTYIPGVNKDPRVKRLATEFRVAGMATAGNVVVSELLGQFLPVITKALDTLPAENAEVVVETRVASSLPSKSTEEEEDDTITIDVEEEDQSDLAEKMARVGGGNGH
jgi:hypothetical protein